MITEKNKLKISIITICFNSVLTIEDTIKSVINQDYENIEYLIIDGGSTDGTLEIINKYKDRIAVIISEKDNGVYDAMNKGIRLATGDVVGILNSDDYYYNQSILSQVMNCFKTKNIDACYGDLIYVNRLNKEKIVRRWIPGEYDKSKINNGWIIPHPTFFVKKEMYGKFGLFNASFRIAGDYELILRFIKNGINIFYLPSVLVCMREGGLSARNFKHRRRGWQELKLAWEVNNLKRPMFFIGRRIISKLPQFFKR